MTKLIIDGSEVDLSPDVFIALSFLVNDIAEVKDRQSNHSNQFRLPLTGNNKSILESAEKVNTISTVPYSKLPAKLVQEGVETIPNGTAHLERTEDSYEVIITSGNRSFFSLLEGLKLSDLDFSDLDHVWNLTNVEAFINNTEGIVYPIVDYGNAVNNERKVNVRYLLPWIFVKDVFFKIIDEIGWTVSGAVLESDFFNSLIMSLPTMKQDSAKLVALADVTAAETYPTEDFSQVVNLLFNNIISDPLEADLSPGVLEEDSNVFGPYTQYNVLNSGTYSFKTTVNYTIVDTVSTYIQIAVLGSDPLTYLAQSNIILGAASGSVSLVAEGADLTVGDKVTVRIIAAQSGANDGTFTIEEESTFECTEGETSVIFGTWMPISINLPDISQKDFLKSIFQILCITPQPKPNSTELQLVQFKEIVANKGQARDWSDKLDNQKPPLIEYHPATYAQKNWMRYQEDDTVTEELGDASFDISDEVLDEEKDLFTLPFSATEMITKLKGLLIPEILRVDVEEITDSSPRILILEKTVLDDNITYTDGIVNYANPDPENLAYFSQEGKIFDLSFGRLIAEHYGDLVRILNGYKKITAAFKIDQIDISELNHFIPVYVKSFGHYFYLNRIIEWISGRLAKCELVLIDNEPILFPSDLPLFELVEDICVDASAIELTPVIPGGFFTGTGVIYFPGDNNYYFDPGTSGAGTFTVTYQVGYQTWEMQITVHDLPTVTLADFDDVDFTDPPFALTGGSPGGGEYSGDGVVSGTIFDPEAAGVGTHTITYIYTDENGCSSFAQNTITVT